jgi:pyrroloquinoline quinone biosynthesis protein D
LLDEQACHEDDTADINRGKQMKMVYRNPEVMWREEDDAVSEATGLLEKGEDAEQVGTSLLFADGMMVSLNLLGTEIWKLCDGRTTDDIVNELMAEFEVDPAVLREDVNNFLTELATKGFVRYE